MWHRVRDSLPEVTELSPVLSSSLEAFQCLARCWVHYQCSLNMHACMLSHFSCVQLYVTLWTVAHQAPLSMEFSRQEYWGGNAMPSARGSSQSRDWTCISYIASIAGRFFTYCHTWEASFDMHCLLKNVTQALSLKCHLLRNLCDMRAKWRKKWMCWLKHKRRKMSRGPSELVHPRKQQK